MFLALSGTDLYDTVALNHLTFPELRDAALGESNFIYVPFDTQVDSRQPPDFKKICRFLNNGNEFKDGTWKWKGIIVWRVESTTSTVSSLIHPYSCYPNGEVDESPWERRLLYRIVDESHMGEVDHCFTLHRIVCYDDTPTHVPNGEVDESTWERWTDCFTLHRISKLNTSSPLDESEKHAVATPGWLEQWLHPTTIFISFLSRKGQIGLSSTGERHNGLRCDLPVSTGDTGHPGGAVGAKDIKTDSQALLRDTPVHSATCSGIISAQPEYRVQDGRVQSVRLGAACAVLSASPC
ncbi:hypothetical protein J6590_027321 [Homalodisca vitripennis]|nr:hypothetical protein J6590_027321 [Homalodisca vitripennis]